jgi:hypothetical protein
MRIVISLGEPNTSGTNTMITAQRGSARIVRIQLAMPEYALGDHHGVVDQHADRQHHAHHREDIERQAEEIERGKRDQQRSRDSECDDRGHRPVAQEEEQHRDREHQADQSRIAQIAQRVANALGLIADDDDADALQLRQCLRALDLLERGVDHFDDVGLSRLEHVESDRRTAVEMAADLQLGRDHLDLRDIGEAHGRGDPQVADVIERAELADRADAEALTLFGDLAGADGEVALLQQRRELLHVDAVRRHPSRIDQDAHLARRYALQLHASDARHALERTFQIAFERVVLIGEILIGGDPHHDHRLIRRIEGESEYAIGAGGQLRTDRIELGAHVECRGVDVAAPIELDLERRLLGLGARAQLFDAGERCKSFLDRPRDQLFHLLGRRAGVGDDHLHAGEGDVRKFLERQQLQRDETHEHQSDEGHRRRYGPLQCRARVEHAQLPVEAGAATVALA